MSNAALVLVDSYRVATKGQPLTASQAKMLCHMGAKVHEFAPRVVAAFVDAS